MVNVFAYVTKYTKLFSQVMPKYACLKCQENVAI